MIKFQIPHDSNLVLKKAEMLLELVQAKLSTGEVTTPDKYINEMYSAFRELFSELKKPILTKYEIDKHDIRDPEKYSQFLTNLRADLLTLIESVRSVTDAAAKGFNLAAAKKGILEVIIKKAQSLSSDLQLVDDDLSQSVMVSGDDFSDQSKIVGGSCDVISGAGIGLHRKGSINAATPTNAKVEVPRDIRDGLYEGRFYAPLGKAEPEGNAFHWSSLKPRTEMKNKTWTGGVKRNVAGYKSKYTDEGANENDRQAVRKSILDHDPTTYWQIERTERPKSLKLWQDKTEAADLETPQSITLNEVADLVASEDNFDMEVPITVVIEQASPVNWISLVPLNFYEGSYLEVLTVETSPDDTTPFEELPNLEEYMNERILTQEANEQLQPEEVKGVLTDTKAFAGQGLWVFPERLVKRVRIVLRQTIPIPSPYSIYRATYETDRTTTKIITEKKKSWTGTVKRTSTTVTDTEHISQQEDISYAESIMLKEGDLSQITPSMTAALATPYSDTDTLDSHSGKDVFGGEGSGRYGNTTITLDNWEVAGKIEVPKYDVVRYAIGIRDLNISRYLFDEQSEFVSTMHNFPLPIEKIAIDTLERLPGVLSTADATEPWIKYFISFDGENWTQLAPIDKSGMNLMNIGIPKILNINSDLPEEARNPKEGYIEADRDVYRVMLKVEMKRAPDVETDSPILKSYRIKAFLRGEL